MPLIRMEWTCRVEVVVFTFLLTRGSPDRVQFDPDGLKQKKKKQKTYVHTTKITYKINEEKKKKDLEIQQV